MSEHAREHEERLAAWLGGEGRPGEAELERWLASCSRCRESWARLSDLSGRLQEAGAAQHAALTELEGAAPAPGEERLLETLERASVQETRVHRRRRWPLAAAAVLLLLLTGGAWLARSFLLEEGEGRTWLGDGGLRLLEPVGEVRSFERFSWTYDGEAASYTIGIRAAPDSQSDASPVEFQREIRRWKETSWSPDGPTRDALPERIVWRITACDEFGSTLDSEEASASLSSD